MASGITATFTTEELVLLKHSLDRLHFLGGDLVRAQAWELIKKIDALLPPPKFSS